MNPIRQLARGSVAAIEMANIILTQDEAAVGTSPRDVFWTHRKTTLYRYRSSQRAACGAAAARVRPDQPPGDLDLRPGSSLIEFLLDEGFDASWSIGGSRRRGRRHGFDSYICDELRWAIRERLRASGEEELTLVGWCIGGTLCAIYAALHPDAPLRNLILLTTPVDANGSLYRKWVGRDSVDVDYVSDVYQAVPGQMIDWRRY